MTDSKEWTNFRHGYNLAKESVSDKELIFNTEIESTNIHKQYFGDIITLEEDICDSREVEFVQAKFSEEEGSRCI